ncbi:MAG: MlaD family protein, partial [Acidimicrobiales bacterium]
MGLISVLLIGAITGAAFLVGLLHLLEHTYSMEGTFTDAAGLRSGDDVKVAGVKVGRVTGIHADRAEGLVEVSWVVNKGVDIKDGAGADIALETLLGSKFIRITNPDTGQMLMERLPANKRLIPYQDCSADGRCIARTTTPVDVFDLTRNATERIEATDNDKLNLLIKQLAEITRGKRGTVTDLIQGIDQVSSAINARETQLKALLDHADELSAHLADKDQTLVQLIDSSRVILDFLVQRRAELATALGAGSDAVRSLSRVIDTNRVQLDAILGDLHPTLAVVHSNLPDLNRALAIAGPAFFGQSLAGSHGPWLDIYVAA